MGMDIMQNQRQVRLSFGFSDFFITDWLKSFYFSSLCWIGSKNTSSAYFRSIYIYKALSFFFKQDVPLFTADGSMFYTILAAKQGARGEFHHIAGLSAQVGEIPVTLVILPQSVIPVTGVSEDRDYTANLCNRWLTTSCSSVMTQAIFCCLFSA